MRAPRTNRTRTAHVSLTCSRDAAAIGIMSFATPDATCCECMRTHVLRMFEWVRLDTLHPALVHLPLGMIPLMFLAYGAAAWKRGARWMFAGDFALAVTAVVITVAAAFGYVAYFRLTWPQNLQPWPLLHLALGSLTTVAIWLLCALRWRARHEPIETSASARWTGAALGVTVLAVATGYIGGEILVYHGGMAVKASADGMLAPPLRSHDASPSSLPESMGRLRAVWASSVTIAAQAVTTKPSAAAFTHVADDARAMERLARWIVDWGHNPANNHRAERGRALSEYAADMESQAKTLEQAADQHDLPALVDAIGKVSRSCAQCHVDKRWHDASADASNPVARLSE